MTTNASAEPSFLTTLPAWRALTVHAEQMRDVHLRELFANDPSRGERLAVEAAGLYLDYSKNRISDDDPSPRQYGRDMRTPRTHRGHVPRPEDQHDGGSRGAPRRAARAAR